MVVIKICDNNGSSEILLFERQFAWRNFEIGSQCREQMKKISENSGEDNDFEDDIEELADWCESKIGERPTIIDGNSIFEFETEY